MKLRMKHCVRKGVRASLTTFLILPTLLSTTGCVSPARNYVTCEKYADFQSEVPSPPEGCGRVYVYMLNGGPKGLDDMGYNSTYSLDRHVYTVLGETFQYKDLEAGEHKITADGVGYEKPQYGRHAVTFNVAPGETKYCRIDLSETGWGDFWKLILGSRNRFSDGLAKWEPIMVDAAVAQRELEELVLYKGNYGKAQKVMIDE